MQTRLHFAALLFTTIAFTQVAQADQLASIKAKGELVCGTLGTDEPNSFIDARSRQLVGYEVDLCRAIAQGLGVKPVIKQLAVAARIPELQQGRIDILTASLTHNKEREALIDFSLSTFYTGQRVLVKKSSNITTVAGLAGKKVLTVKGGTQEPNIRKAVPGVDVVTFETAGQAYLGLQQGKGAGYVDDEVSLLNNYAKLGAAQKDYIVLPQNISQEVFAFGIRKGETGVKTAVDKVLRELEKSGEAEKLFFKWYGPTSNVKFQKRTFRIESDKIDA
ncbi:ABC transporter glutamine-binding protein GlnH precursor [Janthinobacterium sp. KBS0711]|uniref:transporter substrate-binding domain-containing protein n=1 Tax=Janthinobacterium sp. KBS0711 TaxID=1649647 RepID=UPI0006276DA9|nr:transporter substrate-binding domain-containing protein [Janthinobacterium sp. KBS0711]KKO65473.1 ABC transporter glutamine-binding protein GlnH precursor [Janthinobacterium sp. KBS0711]TSD71302.1 transporter substrate-binding domain-containing protein [Janthinobacterium sp. KBS0711]